MTFQRYLSAKRTVDDRALNRRIGDRLADEAADTDHLRVLEVGAGVGATAARLVSKSWFPDRATYTLLDVRSDNVAVARDRVPERAGPGVALEFEVADAFSFLDGTDREWDLLVAQSFADLVDPMDALAAFRDALAPDGLAYLPLTFDGGTAFEPVADREFEDRLVDRFHRHIDRTGDSRAGRHLLSAASEGGAVLAAGSSDWVVRPRGGSYPADEAFFLRYIVDTVSGAVSKENALDPARLSEWTARRHDQIDDAKLVYVAHQLDLLVR